MTGTDVMKAGCAACAKPVVVAFPIAWDGPDGEVSAYLGLCDEHARETARLRAQVTAAALEGWVEDVRTSAALRRAQGLDRE